MDSIRSSRIDGLIVSTSIGLSTLGDIESFLADRADDARRPALRRVLLLVAPGEARLPEVGAFLANVAQSVSLQRPAPMFEVSDQFRSAPIPTPTSPAEGGSMSSAPMDSLTSWSGEDPTSRVRLPRPELYRNLPINSFNLRFCVRLWTRASSGRLNVSMAPAGGEGWMTWGRGGALDGQGLELLGLALHGGELSFEPSHEAVVGDRRATGAVLFSRVRPVDASDWQRCHSFRALIRPGLQSPVDLLPLVPQTRDLLAAPDSSVPLGELLARHDAAAGNIAADLQALDTLGLLPLGDPVARLTASSSRPGRPAALIAPRQTGSDAESEDTSIASSFASRQGRSNAARMEKTLRDLVVRLTGASPAMVLGLDPKSDQAMVTEMGERLTRRYQGLSQDINLTLAAREDARALLAMVAPAVAGWRTGAGPMTVAREIELLRAQAARQLAAGEVGEALKALRAAHRRDSADPEVLAELAWATRLDPAAEVEERSDGALGYAMLAVQLGPGSWMGHFTLARLLLEAGSLTEALASAMAADRIDPGRAETAELVGRIQHRMGPEKAR